MICNAAIIILFCHSPVLPLTTVSPSPSPSSPPAGISSPRSRNTQGGPLPNERTVTSSVLVDVNRPDPNYTSSLMQWAQFMDHDFAHVPFPSLGKFG